VCTLAVRKKNQGRFRYVGSDHSLVSSCSSPSAVVCKFCLKAIPLLREYFIAPHHTSSITLCVCMKNTAFSGFHFFKSTYFTFVSVNICKYFYAAHDNLVGWGYMPQAGRSWVRFPILLDLSPSVSRLSRRCGRLDVSKHYCRFLRHFEIYNRCIFLLNNFPRRSRGPLTTLGSTALVQRTKCRCKEFASSINECWRHSDITLQFRPRVVHYKLRCSYANCVKERRKFSRVSRPLYCVHENVLGETSWPCGHANLEVSNVEEECIYVVFNLLVHCLP
jgi:hypothetical protein